MLSIATRPDCLSDEVIQLLKELNQKKPVWVELGLQTIHEDTAAYIRRGYSLDVYEDSIKRLQEAEIEVITHVIIGLPGEDKKRILETIKYLAEPLNGRLKTQGIKLQLLHVLEGTDLADDYRKGLFEAMSLETYMDILFDAIRLLPPEMVVHRITGDGPKSILIEPRWSANKKLVLGTIQKEMKLRDIWQGDAHRS